jgi:hypothetical protein
MAEEREGLKNPPLLYDLGGFDGVQFGEILFYVGFSLRCDLALIWFFAVACVNFFYRLHAFCYFAEGRESLLIQKRVIAEIYEELRGAGVGAGGGEGDGAGAIRFLDGIVFKIGSSPSVIHFGVGA